MCRVSEFVNVFASKFCLVEISTLTCLKLIKTNTYFMHYFTANAVFCADEMMIMSFWGLTLITPTTEFLLFGLFKTPHWAVTLWINRVCSLSLVLWFSAFALMQDVWGVPEKEFFLTLVSRTPKGQCWELQRASALYWQRNWDTQNAISEPELESPTPSMARDLLAPTCSDGICCVPLQFSQFQKRILKIRLYLYCTK